MIIRNSNKPKFSSTVIALLIVGIIAAVACGASGGKKNPATKSAKQAPLAPLSYDPNLSFAPLVEKVSPAVVNIKISKKVKATGFGGPSSLFDFFFGPRERGFGRPDGLPDYAQKAMGSGFIIDAAGYVVTNHHVVDGADEIEVTLSDERVFQAEVVGSDERTDVALLKLKEAGKLPTVQFGDSSALKVGDHVVAIGNPFGLDHTVTSGIVSAKERVIGAGPYDEFIQTDASINPGNSGGPLFNLSGEVIGINTAIARTGQGIGFAIPSDLAKGLIDSIREKGKVVRGWLGIVFQPLDEPLKNVLKLKDTKGALVTQVNEGSPGDTGGLQAKDVIVAVNNKRLNSARDLPSMVAGLRPEQTYPFTVIRDGKEKTLNIKIGTMPDDIGSPNSTQEKTDTNKKLGFSIAPLDAMSRSQLNAESLSGGVVVTEVNPDSHAAESIQRGDIITEVNNMPINTLESFKAAVSKTQIGDDMLLRIYRKGAWTYAAIRIQ
ncbi:MAG: DegQ family serine endoprotease [Deltaproteobacteria bacterium]|nr:DegQ family serine endoprotease [Deltaproteobacteria bacterium]MBN2672156.1 DegQ family serine endoprotease [Deltaproteobacteria bacterium]